MRIYHIISVVALGLLFSCSPKTGKETAATKDNSKDAKSGDFRSMAPTPGTPRPIEIGTFSQFTLSNGMKVIVVENHKLPQVTYDLTIDNDTPLEGGKSGLAGLVGETMGSGTTSKTKAQIDETVDYLGANLNTSGSGGYASSLTKHTDKILALFAEVILEPSFPEAEFEKNKKQTLSGLQTAKDDPNAIAGNLSRRLTYGDNHPYGEITTESTISSITLQDVKDFYSQNFKPGKAYMVVVGDITPEVAKAKVEKYFGKWASGITAMHKYNVPAAVASTDVAFVDKPGAVQSVIEIIQPIELKPGAPDVIPSRVANSILGNGFSGRLFKNLREDKAYTYGAYSGLSSDKLVGNFNASASVRNEVTDSAIVQFLYEINRLRDEPVSAEELALAKSYIAGAFARSLEDPSTVADFALNTNLYNLPADYYSTYLQKLDKVSIADVQSMAKKYMDPNKARIIVVGNEEQVYGKLAQFDKLDGKVQLYDIYGNPKKAAQTNVDIDAATILNNYFTAAGGVDKLKAVKTVETRSSLDLMGNPMVSRMIQNEGKLYMDINMGGMSIMKQVYDGTSGVAEQQGQRMPITGQELEALKEQGALFPEMQYLTNPAFKVEVKGIEDVNGVPCYKLSVMKPSGTSSVEYYDSKTGLKVQEIQTQTVGGQSQTVTNEYKDYKAVDGIMFPHTISVSGVLPVPMVMKVTEVKVNQAVDAGLFKI